MPLSIQSMDRVCLVGIHKKGLEHGEREKEKEESVCNHGNKRLSRASAQCIKEAHFTR